MSGARDLRTWLRSAGLSSDDRLQVTDADAEGHLRRTAALYPLVAVVTESGCELVPSQSGVPGAFGSLFAALAQVTASGLWPRLKMCRNLPCHVGFLDKTRNSAGLYCSAACSSQASMRSYRQRQKSA